MPRTIAWASAIFATAHSDRAWSKSRPAVAKDCGLSLLELAYAWAAGAKGVDSIILGPATVEQLEQGVAACKIQLTSEVRARVDSLHRDWSGTDAHYVR